MLSTTKLSEILRVNPKGLKIQQLYLLKNAEYTKEFVKMVAKNGFHALALTVDTQTFGKRRIDIVNAFRPTASL
jgi:isopentenyl diphosphate isomerase/L-lactate dehydrogenase-like FMN-dependent dehydrogenase